MSLAATEVRRSRPATSSAPAPWDPPKPRASTPWTAGAIAITASLTGLAAILMLIGYIVASGTLSQRAQLAGADLGLSSLLLSGGAAVGWLTVGYRNVRVRERNVLAKIGIVEELRDLVPVQDEFADGFLDTDAYADLPAYDSPSAPSGLVAVPGGSLYHLRGCLLVGGKETESITDAERATRRLQPCGVCCR